MGFLYLIVYKPTYKEQILLIFPYQSISWFLSQYMLITIFLQFSLSYHENFEWSCNCFWYIKHEINSAVYKWNTFLLPLQNISPWLIKYAGYWCVHLLGHRVLSVWRLVMHIKSLLSPVLPLSDLTFSKFWKCCQLLSFVLGALIWIIVPHTQKIKWLCHKDIFNWDIFSLWLKLHLNECLF